MNTLRAHFTVAVTDAPASSPALAYLQGLRDAARLANRQGMAQALWFYDTGAHAGRTEGWITGYREGRAAGIQEGREQLAAQLDAERREWLEIENRALAAHLSSTPTFAALCDIRGDHERAARQRQILTERGIEAPR